jgi:hypothetical protein
MGNRTVAVPDGVQRRRGKNVPLWGLVLLIAYASVLALAAAFAVVSRTLMRPPVEPLYGDPADIAGPLEPGGVDADSMIEDELAA